MSDITYSGFKASEIIAALHQAFATFTDKEKQDNIKKTNGIFELRIANDAKEEAVWTIDLKKNATVIKGTAKPKADVTLIMSDDTFTQLANGKLNGQKAFMTGKLKTRGNMMLATKLEQVLKVAKSKQAKL